MDPDQLASGETISTWISDDTPSTAQFYLDFDSYNVGIRHSLNIYA